MPDLASVLSRAVHTDGLSGYEAIAGYIEDCIFITVNGTTKILYALFHALLWIHEPWRNI